MWLTWLEQVSGVVIRGHYCPSYERWNGQRLIRVAPYHYFTHPDCDAMYCTASSAAAAYLLNNGG